MSMSLQSLIKYLLLHYFVKKEKLIFLIPFYSILSKRAHQFLELLGCCFLTKVYQYWANLVKHCNFIRSMWKAMNKIFKQIQKTNRLNMFWLKGRTFVLLKQCVLCFSPTNVQVILFQIFNIFLEHIQEPHTDFALSFGTSVSFQLIINCQKKIQTFLLKYYASEYYVYTILAEGLSLRQTVLKVGLIKRH